MKKPTAVQQAAYRIIENLQFIMRELHRLHHVVSWQRAQLEMSAEARSAKARRRKPVKHPKTLSKEIAKQAATKHASGSPRTHELNRPRTPTPRKKP